MSYEIITVSRLARRHKVSKQAINKLILIGKNNGAKTPDKKIGFIFRGKTCFAKKQGNQYFITIYSVGK